MVYIPKIKNLNTQRAFFIPADTPGRTIKKYLEKKKFKKQNLLFSQLYRSKNNIILLGGIGSPAAVLALEPLIRSGVNEIIVLGFCGGLTEKANPFDAFLIRIAFSEEGTSSHYIPHKNEFLCSKNLFEEVEKRFQSNHIDFKTGSIVSTDAPYRESKEWILEKKNKGIDLVDMETSAVFALAEYYQIKAAAVMVVSDVFKGKLHQIVLARPKFNHRIKQIFYPFFDSSE